MQIRSQFVKVRKHAKENTDGKSHINILWTNPLRVSESWTVLYLRPIRKMYHCPCGPHGPHGEYYYCALVH